jgi:hypothetical protein
MYGRIGGIVFVLVGLTLLGLAVYTALGTVAFLRSASRANGTVSALNAGGSHPQITFQTESGKPISYPQGGLIFGYQPGDAVTVLYAAENPAGSATIDAIGALWAKVIWMGGLGTAMLLGGVFAARGSLGS